MASLIHAVGKRPNHVYRLYGPWGERRIPEALCKADLYILLRKELGLPGTTGRWEVVKVLMGRSWDADRRWWLQDPEAGHAAQP